MGFLDGFDAMGSQLAGSVMDMLNYGQQKQTQKYLMDVQKETWKREDNAVQRRAADMAAAGFNPLLAAGAAATSSTPIQVGTPQMDLSNAESMGAMLRQNVDISKTKADTYRQNIQTEIDRANYAGIKADVEIKNQNARAAKSLADAAATDAAEKAWNLEQWQKRGLPTNEKGIAAQWAGIPQAWEGATKTLPAAVGNVLAGAYSDVKDKVLKGIDAAKEAARLRKEKEYQDAVRSGKVSLQGGR